MSNDRRECLVARLRALSSSHLRYVEAFFTALECGDSSPLSAFSSSPPFPGSASPFPPVEKDWPHAPLHRLTREGVYLVTAGTLHKEHYFRGARRLNLLESAILKVMKQHGWRLEAWAVFSNHYHFLVHATEDSSDLRGALKQLHGSTAHDLNRLDGVAGRTVWHNFWDTAITFEKSYLARLNYVHQNAVKHGLVLVANQYRWCSAAWFERVANRAQVGTIYGFKTDRLRIEDDYAPLNGGD